MQEYLLDSLKKRDPEAISEVFASYSDQIYRLAIGILHDEQQADGVVQNTFVTLIEKIDSFQGRSHISTWLYRIAYNECMGRIRGTKVVATIDEYMEDDFMPENFVNWDDVPDVVMRGQEATQQMTQAIEQLPELLRTTFILRDVEGLSTVETAKVMNISESAVKVRLHRARLALRELLADYFEEYLK